MTIVRDDSLERDARVDRMLNEFSAAKSRREAKLAGRAPDSRPDDHSRATPSVPAEYLSLYTYLEHRSASSVVLTFEQVEAVLGFALPPSARTEPAWWAEAAISCLSHSSAWTGTGRTAVLSVPARTVTFERR